MVTELSGLATGVQSGYVRLVTASSRLPVIKQSKDVDSLTRIPSRSSVIPSAYRSVHSEVRVEKIVGRLCESHDNDSSLYYSVP